MVLGKNMAKTRKERIVSTFEEKVRDALARAKDAEIAENDEMYWYWKGVVHGLQRGWDISQGECQA